MFKRSPQGGAGRIWLATELWTTRRVAQVFQTLFGNTTPIMQAGCSARSAEVGGPYQVLWNHKSGQSKLGKAWHSGYGTNWLVTPTNGAIFYRIEGQ